MLTLHSTKLFHNLASHNNQHHKNCNTIQHVTTSNTILSSLSTRNSNSNSNSNSNANANSNSTRRSLLLLSTALSLPSPPYSLAADATLDTTITDRVFLDLSICSTYFRTQDVPMCSDSEPMGRIVLGLYGKLVPITVSNFKTMCTGPAGSSYKNTVIHKVLPGQFFVAGKQGRRERPPPGLVQNKETVESRAFMLEHSRPGVVSLCLSENDDEDDIKLDPEYHNVEFLITTGPGPCPQLDGRNIVFGTVLEGMDVVRQVAATPTYKPGERIKLFNDLAEFIGDGRAENARNIWDRPLKTIYISNCGELKVAKPSLSPSLP